MLNLSILLSVVVLPGFYFVSYNREDNSKFIILIKINFVRWSKDSILQKKKKGEK